ncbi:PREDICTED: SNF-related serine/threonine-protein kinase isoform X2 [Ceratotherium simum simum]|uniref:non-specific serine/threonine protein kinase n=1 Tax=Ceratotherium simum simum TaxID=73337 RepID=A0ABM1D428_CERSS|nr:PREDICTED: SNF-related serine/threonine-protein kinase isoform X2 [Ceratotherium simum simum]
MISAGCGDSAARRESSAPRPLRTDARLPAESLLRFCFGTSSIWPLLRRTKQPGKHSNKDYSVCSLQGEKVAVKVIDKTKLDTLATGHLFQEVRCMKLVQHPNIVRLYEVIDTQTKLYLILELGDGGDMFDYIMKHEEGLNEDLAKKYFAQIVHAISYCHKLHVVHRDLKPENVVFFEKQGLVKLTDFGFSNKFQPGKKLTTSCGSLAYSAPEILLGDEYDAPAVDIWSLGVILFMLVCGQPPFQEANDSETLTMIMDCKYTVPSHVSKECKDLITRMLQRDPKRRASLEEIENHPWLQGVDPSPATKYNIPLVSYKNLSEEEHNSIIQRMVLGDIADRDAIVEALETNRYNHITATYFLLAERILREKQEKEIQTRSASPSNIKAQFRQSWPTKIDVPQDLEDDLTATPLSHATVPQSPARAADSVLNGHRSKGLCDSAKKDDLPELAGPALSTMPPASLKPTASGRKCLFRVEEDEEEDEEDKKPMSLSTQVVLRRKPSVTNRLTSRKSAPVLNQIFEEGESDDEFDMDENLPPKLSRLKMNIASPGTVHKRYHRRKSQGRGSSCSSSETSDDDSESRRRLDKDSGFTYSWHRRDSSEGPPGSEGDGGGQSKPSNGSGGVDKASPSENNAGGGSPASGSGGNPTNTSGTTRRCAGPGNSTQLASRSAGELVESLKLMSLCLGSQLHGSTRYIIDPQNGLSFSSVKVQEKSTWKMCITSTGNAGQAPAVGSIKFFSDHVADTTTELERIKSKNLKNNVLQLPLCEKTISVNIQRNPKEGLLCASSQASCCHVI